MGVTRGACIDHNGSMSGSAVTPPKGRATRSRNDSAGRRSLLNPKLQWTLVVLGGLAVLGAIFYFGRDIQSDYNGAGLDDPAVVVSRAGDAHVG